MTESISIGSGTDRGSTVARHNDCLFHPLADFLFLGGGSFVVIGILWLFFPEVDRLTALPYVIAISHFVNEPHFIFSYQIFYRRFTRRLFSPELSAMLRVRYLFAGIVVPAALSLFFFYSVAFGDARLIGYAGNLMVFTVGWHYAKQGFGMVIVDSVLKRQFFAPGEKRLLLVNAHASWILFYLWINQSIHARDIWNLKYYTFDLPDPLLYAAAAFSIVTSVLTFAMLARKWVSGGGGLPINGLAAYVASLYLWLLGFKLGPVAVILIIPAFHSLQYQYVVWRYQLNLERARADSNGGDWTGRGAKPWYVPKLSSMRFLLFNLIGLLLAYLAFWAIPRYLNGAVAYDRETFGETLFFFIYLIFINVHHYFIDNVIWRAENSDTKMYLFSHGAAARQSG